MDVVTTQQEESLTKDERLAEAKASVHTKEMFRSDLADCLAESGDQIANVAD